MLTDLQRFYSLKTHEICNKTHVTIPTLPEICCRTTSGDLHVQICSKIANDAALKHITDDKNEMGIIAWALL